LIWSVEGRFLIKMTQSFGKYACNIPTHSNLLKNTCLFVFTTPYNKRPWKKLHWEGTNTVLRGRTDIVTLWKKRPRGRFFENYVQWYTDTHTTHGHRDLKTDSAQWAHSVKSLISLVLYLRFVQQSYSLGAKNRSKAGTVITHPCSNQWL
jgi:hypothetical protein